MESYLISPAVPDVFESGAVEAFFIVFVFSDSPLIFPIIVELKVLLPAIVSSPVVWTRLDKAVVTVVEKLASLPKALANSFNVFKTAGAPFVNVVIAAVLLDISFLLVFIWSKSALAVTVIKLSFVEIDAANLFTVTEVFWILSVLTWPSPIFDVLTQLISNFAFVIALSAIFAVVTLLSAIFTVMTALLFILPLVMPLSAIFAVVTFRSVILSAVTASSAILSVVTLPSAIFDVVK